MAPDRRLDPPGGEVEAVPDNREILARQRPGAAVIGEKLGKAAMRGVGLGGDHEAGGVLVEAVHDARAR